MKIKTLILGFILTFFSCAEKENISSNITVDLNVNTQDNPFRKSMIPLTYLDSINKDFKGIINKDSSYVMSLNTVSPRDLKKGELNQENIDSHNTKIHVLSGYNNGKQYYILDLNGNKDFGDEEIVEFDKDISEQENYRDSFKIREIEVVKLNQSNFYKQSTHLQFLPAPKYFTYKSETENEKFKHSLQLAALKHDYFLGTFISDNIKYDVGANKGLFRFEFIFKKSDTLFYKRNDQKFSKYKLKDTIKLKDKYFRIDSLSIQPPTLTINEITNKQELYGFRTNDVSKNYEVVDLNGNSTTLKDLAEKRGFLLLDFWGTWCVPCKELTPQLVNLNKKYSNKMQLASLAFELDSKPVLEYTAKNKMNWYNGIIKGKPKSGDKSSPIISDLRIECYPTFIVLDSNLNILFRNCGSGDNYLELEAFLSSILE